MPTMLAPARPNKAGSLPRVQELEFLLSWLYAANAAAAAPPPLSILSAFSIPTRGEGAEMILKNKEGVLDEMM